MYSVETPLNLQIQSHFYIALTSNSLIKAPTFSQVINETSDDNLFSQWEFHSVKEKCYLF